MLKISSLGNSYRLASCSFSSSLLAWYLSEPCSSPYTKMNALMWLSAERAHWATVWGGLRCVHASHRWAG
eukprot:3178484-Lingulodinium_polyedra.AAC.1